MEAIDSEWLARLVDERAQESLVLDFKRELPARDDKGRNGFLSDVAAFANSQGGRLIYGIEENGSGSAERIVPLSGPAEDAQLRLQEIISSGIEPRLDGCVVKSYTVEGGFLLVVHIPEQFHGPFEAHSGKWRRFPIRQGATTAEMSYRQLRDGFGRRERIAADMQDWRTRRILQLETWIQQARLTQGPWVVLHLMPVASFASSTSIDLHRIRQIGFRFRGHLTNARFNLDGIRFTLGSMEPPSEYVQWFRSGVIELAWQCSTSRSEDLAVGSSKALRISLTGLMELGRIMGELTREGTASVAMSLLHIAGYRLHHPAEWSEGNLSTPFPDGVALLEEEYIEDVGRLAFVAEPLAKAFSDKLFQAFGENESCYFGRDGKLQLHYRREWSIGDV